MKKSLHKHLFGSFKINWNNHLCDYACPANNRKKAVGLFCDNKLDAWKYLRQLDSILLRIPNSIHIDLDGISDNRMIFYKDRTN